jgi:hypothetical protein
MLRLKLWCELCKLGVDGAALCAWWVFDGIDLGGFPYIFFSAAPRDLQYSLKSSDAE